MSVDDVPPELGPPQCRFCGATANVVLTRTAEGWECSDLFACYARRPGAAVGNQ